MSGPNLLPSRLIAGYRFYGPVPLVLAPQSFAGLPGVYVVASIGPYASRWLDVGESENVGNRVLGHDRKACWQANSTGPIVVFAHTELTSILRLEKEWHIRSILRPTCGSR